MAISNLILAIASAGLSPLGHVRAPEIKFSVVAFGSKKNIAYHERTVEDCVATVQTERVL